METRSRIFLVVVGVVFSVFSAEGSRAESGVREVGVTLPATSTQVPPGAGPLDAR